VTAPRPADLTGFSPLLEALDGIAYITDFRGDFIAWGRRNWSSFADENGASPLAAAASLNSLAACADPETEDAYRRIYRALEEGKLDSYSFGFRCDSPRVRRELRMALNTLVLEGRRLGIIHHATLVFEAERPTMGLLEHSPSTAEQELIRMCSYCLRVWDAPDWIEPEQYYQQGGSSEVAITHGICADCRERILGPIVRLH
jgi:hypothetical protein